MSPSEEQLRRALSEGQGAGPDVDTVLERAAAYRRERRTKVLSAVAVVAVVAGISTGVVVVASKSGSSHSTASEKGAGNAAGSGVFGFSSSGAAASQPVASLLATTCPPTIPTLPTRKGAAAAPVFSSAVSTLTVCAYGRNGVVNDATGAPVAETFSGAAATTIADSIESAPAARPAVNCFAIPQTNITGYVVLARDGNGSNLGAVVIEYTGCVSQLSNGLTTRYGWQPPAVMQAFMALAQQAAGPHGSPVQPAPSTS